METGFSHLSLLTCTNGNALCKHFRERRKPSFIHITSLSANTDNTQNCVSTKCKKYFLLQWKAG